MPASFHAQRPWSAERPQTLVICCSDGRWHAQVEEFVQHEVSERADMYAIPGSAAVVDPWNSSFEEARVFEGALRLLVEHHDLQSIWLIAHQGCAYYRLRHPHREPAQIRQRQEEDLTRARVILLERHPALRVREVFASLDAGRVHFTTLDERSAGERIDALR